MSSLFDIACNFSSERFDNDLEIVIDRAIKENVNKFLVVSASIKGFDKVYKIYQKHSENCLFYNWNSSTSCKRI
jgi:TatD DNase family protein